MSIKGANFGLQVGVGFVGRIVTTIVAFLGSIVLARELGPANYGSFYLLFTVVMLLDNPVTGWFVACRKRYAEADSSSEEILGAALGGVVIGSIAFAILGLLASGPLGAFADVPGAGVLAGVLFAGSVTFSAMTGFLRATSRFGGASWMNALRDAIRVPGQIALVLAGYGVAGMVGGIVLANVVVALFGFYVIGIRPTVPSRGTVREIWSFARSSIPNNLLGRAIDRMDTALLGLLATTATVGYYEVAFKMTMPAMFVAGVASSGLMAQVSNRDSRDLSITDEIEQNLGFGSIVAIPLFFGAVTLGEPVVVTAYSSQFEGAGAFIAGLALFHLFRSQKALLSASLNGLERPDLNLRVSLVVFTGNLALGIGLFYLLGPIGIVVATVLSEAAAYGLTATYVRSLTESLDLVPTPLWHQLVSGGLMGLGVFVARQVVGLPNWWTVPIIIGLGGLGYFAVLWAISHPFRATVRGVLGDVPVFG
jgi:O-antigen/teichoic acid export membrane protein